jgi:hypothetical protein
LSQIKASKPFFIGIKLSNNYQYFNRKFIKTSRIDGSNAYNGSWTSNHAVVAAHAVYERLLGLFG